eukprot:6460096-Pyramimonas_sp.AAC.1
MRDDGRGEHSAVPGGSGLPLPPGVLAGTAAFSHSAGARARPQRRPFLSKGTADTNHRRGERICP